MKTTLLSIVQSILSSMDSDEVNSIDETPESLQVANIVKDSFYEVLSRANLPEHYRLFELVSSGTIAKPTLMTLPTNTQSLIWLKYDNRDVAETIPEYSVVKPMEIDDFIEYTYNFDTTLDEFFSFEHIIDSDTFDFFGYNNAMPRYYTVLQDNTILFDSYDVAVETNLQKSKTVAYGFITPSFTLDDAYVPDIDGNMFPLLMNEAKRQAFVELKQTANPVAEQRSRRHWVRSQKIKENAKTATTYSRYPKYGRK